MLVAPHSLFFSRRLISTAVAGGTPGGQTKCFSEECRTHGKGGAINYFLVAHDTRFNPNNGSVVSVFCISCELACVFSKNTFYTYINGLYQYVGSSRQTNSSRRGPKSALSLHAWCLLLMPRCEDIVSFLLDRQCLITERRTEKRKGLPVLE